MRGLQLCDTERSYPPRPTLSPSGRGSEPPCPPNNRMQSPNELRPSQARQDRAAHDPVFVVFGEEIQLFREMRHALAIGALGE
jgi:hypothetical protein